MVNLLFIHPDNKVAALYQEKLGKHFVFDSAQDGLTALRKMKIVQPHIMVSEWGLPMLSGLGLLKAVRKSPSFHHIGFFFISDEEYISHALSHGANGWLKYSEASPDALSDIIWKHLRVNRHILNY
jgi:DNA-binding NarL/FixJ family response regulator